MTTGRNGGGRSSTSILALDATSTPDLRGGSDLRCVSIGSIGGTCSCDSGTWSSDARVKVTGDNGSGRGGFDGGFARADGRR